MPAWAGLPSDVALGPGDFAGPWQVARVIDDRRAGQAGVFEGTARFSPNGAGRLRYAETGRLRMGGGVPMQADRVYLWRFDRGRVEVSFDDGRPFHGFALGGVAGADHWCDPDAYRVAYDFSDFPRWRAVWTVTGPRKDYVMDSAYTRA